MIRFLQFTAALVFIALLTLAQPRDTSAETPSGAYVVAVNNPLAYFAGRLAGDAIDVRLPVPPDTDPAFWQPTVDDILLLQGAELILLNGAGYSPWLNKVSISRRTDAGEDVQLARLHDGASLMVDTGGSWRGDRPDEGLARYQLATGETLLEGAISLLGHRQDNPVDHIARTFMVDDAPGAKVGNGQESGARQKLVAAASSLPPPWDIGRQGQPGKTVTRQKALAGKVAVAIKV